MSKPNKDEMGTAVAVNELGAVATNDDNIVEGVKVPQLFGEDLLHDIVDFDAAMAALESAGVTVDTSENYGSGFAVMDKETLVKVPFLILQWKFSVGTFGPMVTCFIVTKDGRRGIINDGSTGIRDQMVNITRRKLSENGGDMSKVTAGLLVPAGLTRSDYEFMDKNDNTKKSATTFYITT